MSHFNDHLMIIASRICFFLFVCLFFEYMNTVMKVLMGINCGDS